MNLDELKKHVDERFDGLHDELKNYLQRTASLESSVKWLATLVVVIITGLIHAAISNG